MKYGVRLTIVVSQLFFFCSMTFQTTQLLGMQDAQTEHETLGQSWHFHETDHIIVKEKLIKEDGFTEVDFYSAIEKTGTKTDYIKGFFKNTANKDVDKLKGLFLERPNAKATVICIPGFLPGRKETYAPFVKLAPKDCNLFFIELANHGESGGSAQSFGKIMSLFSNLKRYGFDDHKDIVGAIFHAVEKTQGKPIILLGRCSGAFLAAKTLIKLRTLSKPGQDLVKDLNIQGFIFDSGLGSLKVAAQNMSDFLSKMRKKQPREQLDAQIDAQKKDTQEEKGFFGQLFSDITKGTKNLFKKVKLKSLEIFAKTINTIFKTSIEANDLETNLFGTMEKIADIKALFIHSNTDSLAPIADAKKLADQMEHADFWETVIEAGRNAHAVNHLKCKKEYRQKLHEWLGKTIESDKQATHKPTAAPKLSDIQKAKLYQQVVTLIDKILVILENPNRTQISMLAAMRPAKHMKKLLVENEQNFSKEFANIARESEQYMEIKNFWRKKAIAALKQMREILVQNPIFVEHNNENQEPKNQKNEDLKELNETLDEIIQHMNKAKENTEEELEKLLQEEVFAQLLTELNIASNNVNIPQEIHEKLQKLNSEQEQPKNPEEMKQFCQTIKDGIPQHLSQNQQPAEEEIDQNVNTQKSKLEGIKNVWANLSDSQKTGMLLVGGGLGLWGGTKLLKGTTSIFSKILKWGARAAIVGGGKKLLEGTGLSKKITAFFSNIWEHLKGLLTDKQEQAEQPKEEEKDALSINPIEKMIKIIDEIIELITNAANHTQEEAKAIYINKMSEFVTLLQNPKSQIPQATQDSILAEVEKMNNVKSEEEALYILKTIREILQRLLNKPIEDIEGNIDPKPATNANQEAAQENIQEAKNQHEKEMLYLKKIIEILEKAITLYKDIYKDALTQDPKNHNNKVLEKYIETIEGIKSWIEQLAQTNKSFSKNPNKEERKCIEIVKDLLERIRDCIKKPATKNNIFIDQFQTDLPIIEEIIEWLDTIILDQTPSDESSESSEKEQDPNKSKEKNQNNNNMFPNLHNLSNPENLLPKDDKKPRGYYSPSEKSSSPNWSSSNSGPYNLSGNPYNPGYGASDTGRSPSGYGNYGESPYGSFNENEWLGGNTSSGRNNSNNNTDKTETSHITETDILSMDESYDDIYPEMTDLPDKRPFFRFWQ